MYDPPTFIFVAGDEGVILQEGESGWIIHETEVIDNITAIYGLTENAVWAGTEEGELIYWNGTDWQKIDWPSISSCIGDNAITGIWGTEGYIYFHTKWEMVEWDGVDYRNILSFSCFSGSQRINSIWGNASNEVFISTHDDDSPRTDCDTQYMMWWDGNEFHWF
jgi:hypothetical protein